jgi:hypothetical protein
LQAICVQDQEIKALKEKHEEDKEPINIAGDGKYDSPGEWKVDLTMHSNYFDLSETCLLPLVHQENSGHYLWGS